MTLVVSSVLVVTATCVIPTLGLGARAYFNYAKTTWER